VGRYQLTTPDVLRRLFFQQDPEALKTPMKTLRRSYLIAEPLFPGAPKEAIYYHLTPKAQAALGLPEKFGQPIPLERRVHLYAVLLFCTSGKEPRPLFTLDDFRRTFPMISFETGGAGRFYTRSYYLDADEAGERRLGRILVDEGAKVEGLLEKCRKAFEAAEVELPLFVAERRFALAVVTPAPEKKRALERELRAKPVGPPLEPLRVTVTAIPELAHLQMAKESTRGAA
jgi:hypothetical protein